MRPWSELPGVATPRRRAAGPLRRVLPFLVAGGLLALGWTHLAIVTAGAAVLVTAVTAASDQAAHAVDRILATVGRVTGTAVSWLLLVIVHVLVVAPLALVARLLRRNTLTPDSRSTLTWQRPDAAVPSRARQTFGREPSRPAPGPWARAGRATPRVIGWIVIAVLVDYGLERGGRDPSGAGGGAGEGE